MFGDSSETEMDIEVATMMETKPIIDKEKKLQKVREKLLSNKTHENFTKINYEDVINDPNLTLTQKTIYLQGLTMKQEERFAMLHYKENYLKNAFISQRKFIKKLWRKQRNTALFL